MKILMVCLGNICRSPLAEGILQKEAAKEGLDWQIDSAGTEPFHVGEPPHLLSQKVAVEHGLDLSTQRARRFTKEDFDHFDKLYAMAEDVYEEMMLIGKGNGEASKTDLLLNEVYPGENRSIPDPWYGGEDGFHKAWALISSACTQIIKKYGR